MFRGLAAARTAEDAAGAGSARADDAASPPAESAPEHGAARLGTRRRLLLAFGGLAAAFAAAFGSLVLGLAAMADRLAYLHEHERQMRVALDIASGIRTLYSPHAHPGAAGEVDPAARKRLFGQIAGLEAVVDEPEAIVWVADIAAAARALDRSYGGGVAAVEPASLGGAARRADLEQRLFQVEVNVDRFFSFLRDRVAQHSGAVGELQQRSLRLAVAFVVATLLLAGLLAGYLSRSIAQPLAVLGAGATRIASGDLATRIEIESADEFGALAAKFNEMAASLRQHQEKLVRSEKLAGLGRVAAGIAHELNNPLQVMIGYISLDRDRVQGDVGKHLARIEREAVRCKEIVDALLQLSRPTAAFVSEPVDVRGVCYEVAEAVRMQLGDAAPTIEVRGRGIATGARCRIRQILFNLAKNAADAAGPAGEVRIDVVAAPGPMVHVAVTDTGPGIPPELRGRIFEPFFTTKRDGTGLGLAIARAMTASLGGELELDACAEGGARFTVRIPAAAGAA